MINDLISCSTTLFAVMFAMHDYLRLPAFLLDSRFSTNRKILRCDWSTLIQIVTFTRHSICLNKSTVEESIHGFDFQVNF